MAENSINLLIYFFHIENIGLILAGFLVVVGAITIVWMTFRYFQLRASLMPVIDALKATEGYESFTQQFESINQKIMSIERMHHPWREFTETLIPPLETIDEPGYKIYRNTRRPSEYFSQRVFQQYQIGSPIAPATFVGWGLLFTFLGLVAALTETGRSFSQQDAAEIQRALESLLQVAGTKFWASVGGLFSSICVGGSLAISNSRIGKHLHTISNLLETRLLYVTNERLMTDLVFQSQRQTQRLESMSDEITIAIGDSIKNAIEGLPPVLSESLSKTMEPVTEELRSVTQNLASDNQGALKDMADEFARKVSGASEDSFNQVNAQLERLVASLEVTSNRLAGSGNDLSSGLEAAINNVNLTMRSLADEMSASARDSSATLRQNTQEASQGLQQVIQKLAEQQSAGTAQLTELTNSLGAVSKSAAESMQAMMNQSGESLSKVIHDSVEKTTASVAQSLDGIGDSVKRNMQAATDNALATFNERFEAINGKLSGAASEVTSGLASWQREVQSVGSTLQSVVNQFGNYITHIQKLNTEVEVTEKAIAGSAKAVRDASSPLMVVSDKLSNATQKLEELLQETYQMTTDSKAAFEQTALSMKTSVEGLETTWQQHGSYLKGADEQLESAFRQISDNMTRALQQIGEYTKQLDTELAKSLENLTSFAMELKDLVEEMNDTKGR